MADSPQVNRQHFGQEKLPGHLLIHSTAAVLPFVFSRESQGSMTQVYITQLMRKGWIDLFYHVMFSLCSRVHKVAFIFPVTNHEQRS